MIVSYQLKNQTLSSDEMVDVMQVAEKLRWANKNGEQKQAQAGPLLGMRSSKPCKVVVRQEGGESTPFSSVKFAETDLENGLVYLSGRGTMERIDGKIIRIRNEMI